MPGAWTRAARSMMSNLSMDDPDIARDNLAQDLNPASLREINMELMAPNRQGQYQQKMLMNEKFRIEQMQAAQMRRGAQEYQRRLSQSLDLSQHTGMPVPSREAFMAKLMAQMQRRYPGMIPAQPQARFSFDPRLAAMSDVP